MRTFIALSIAAAALAAPAPARAEDPWTTDFALDPADLATTGSNPWFILEPGYTLVLEGDDEQLTITVLEETRRVGDVETRVVEERETKGGRLKEVSRNFYAISRRTNSVFYFGEEVDMYRNETIADHDGAWLAGTRGARHGLMMPGLPLLGGRYYQEVAPGVAMDRAEIMSVSDTLTTPAAAFRAVLKMKETTPLESFAREYKYYAPGVGLIQDGSLKLVRYGHGAARP
jgi:hypothetical protein